jgi:hypothetical protein
VPFIFAPFYCVFGQDLLGSNRRGGHDQPCAWYRAEIKYAAPPSPPRGGGGEALSGGYILDRYPIPHSRLAPRYYALKYEYNTKGNCVLNCIAIPNPHSHPHPLTQIIRADSGLRFYFRARTLPTAETTLRARGPRCSPLPLVAGGALLRHRSADSGSAAQSVPREGASRGPTGPGAGAVVHYFCT